MGRGIKRSITTYGAICQCFDGQDAYSSIEEKPEMIYALGCMAKIMSMKEGIAAETNGTISCRLMAKPAAEPSLP